MKKIISLVFMIYTLSFGQNLKLTSLSISTGKTPLTSGLTISTKLSNKSSNLMINYNKDLGEIIYLSKLNNPLQVGPTGGFLKNVPWLGILTIFKPLEKIMLLSW